MRSRVPAGTPPVRALSAAGDLQIHGGAQEGEAPVLLEGAGQQMRFGEHLKAIANPDHRAAFGRKGRHRRHDRREAGDGTGAQVVTVGETAGQDYRIHIAE